MSKAVVDTNVLLVANGQHEDASRACRQRCIEELTALQQQGVVVIDDGYRILVEYQRKTQPHSPKGVGDKFLKWLLQNQANRKRVHRVTISETAQDEYAEFPAPALQAAFDPPDRKFAAVANAHPDKPPVWQATDCKWLHWWQALASRGVTVSFLCPDDVCRFYAGKYPGTAVPPLPAR